MRLAWKRVEQQDIQATHRIRAELMTQRTAKADLLLLEDRVGEMDQMIKRLADNNEDCVRLQQLRGVGSMVSTAMIATVGDARQYPKSRQMADVRLGEIKGF